MIAIVNFLYAFALPILLVLLQFLLFSSSSPASGKETDKNKTDIKTPILAGIIVIVVLALVAEKSVTFLLEDLAPRVVVSGLINLICLGLYFHLSPKTRALFTNGIKWKSKKVWAIVCFSIFLTVFISNGLCACGVEQGSISDLPSAKVEIEKTPHPMPPKPHEAK